MLDTGGGVMERLTERWGEDDVWVKDHDYVSAAHRLAAYEDTGLEPEEVHSMQRRLYPPAGVGRG